MRLTPPLNLPAPGRRQCVYGALCGLAHTCVFAKQSLGPIRCDQGALHCTCHPPWLPFFRSYGNIMPSSLTRFHSFTLGYSPHPPVSVYGTDTITLHHPLFSPVDSRTLGLVLRRVLGIRSRLAPTPLHGRPHGRSSFVPVSRMVSTRNGGAGMSTGCPSATPLGPRLRVRLTLR